MVSTCVSCNRKFAAPYSATNTHLCRNCRSNVATSMVAAASSPTVTKSPTTLKFTLATNSAQKSLLTSTPKVTKSGGGKQGSGSGSGGIGSGRNLVPMKCKICNTCFRYRRCLFRHLRENHPGIDQDNLMQYIDMASTSTTDGQQNTTSPTVKGDTSLSGSKAAGVGGSQQRQRGQDVNASTSSSLHVTIGSEVGELTGEGEAITPGNENGSTGM